MGSQLITEGEKEKLIKLANQKGEIDLFDAVFILQKTDTEEIMDSLVEEGLFEEKKQFKVGEQTNIIWKYRKRKTHNVGHCVYCDEDITSNEQFELVKGEGLYHKRCEKKRYKDG